MNTKCPEEKFLNTLDKAIKDCARNKNNKKLEKDLRAIRDFLPDYPVMAVLEAEVRGMKDDFVIMLSDSFKILPFK